MDVKLTDLQSIAVEAIQSYGFCFGSPTINSGAMPKIVETLNFLRGLQVFKGKKGIVFGSHLWGEGDGVKWVCQKLSEVHVEVVGKVQWKLNFGADKR